MSYGYYPFLRTSSLNCHPPTIYHFPIQVKQNPEGVLTIGRMILVVVLSPTGHPRYGYKTI